MITLYTTHCPKCNVLQKKMANKKIDFLLCEDEKEIMEVCTKTGMNFLPILQIGDDFLDFPNAIEWLKNGDDKNEY